MMWRGMIRPRTQYLYKSVNKDQTNRKRSSAATFALNTRRPACPDTLSTQVLILSYYRSISQVFSNCNFKTRDQTSFVWLAVVSTWEYAGSWNNLIPCCSPLVCNTKVTRGRCFLEPSFFSACCHLGSHCLTMGSRDNPESVEVMNC